MTEKNGEPKPTGFRWKGLTAKQAVVTLVAVLVLGALFGTIELAFEWRAAVSGEQARAEQTLALVADSAAEAAFQLSPTLAQRVAIGLGEDPLVAAVQVTDSDGRSLAVWGRVSDGHARGLAEMLFGDLRDHSLSLVRDGLALGRIDLTLNVSRMAEAYFDAARVSMGLTMIRALILSAIVVGIFYFMITRPLVRVSAEVETVDADRPGDFPISELAGHRGDEFGQLVGNLNRLLQAFQTGLNERDKADRELKELAASLEARVVERTRDLAQANDRISELNDRLKAENLRLGAELDVTRKIQEMVLPRASELEGIKSLDIATFMEPATEVGGDYFDILNNGENVRIAIGDVTGHGLESGVVMLMTQSAVRTLSGREVATSYEVMDRLNQAIYGNVNRMGSDKNLTFALMDYGPGAPADGSAPDAAGHIRISGQHETLIKISGDEVEVIDTMDLGFPIGLVDDVSEFVHETVVALKSGDVVILFTDGITEAADRDENLYGMDRLIGVSRGFASETADTIKNAIIRDVKAHVDGRPLYDDLTLIVLKQR
ncbi:MAG: PP2C family protein-serine/threonine phosphatase [Magnetovibrionaceae bacterium]